MSVLGSRRLKTLGIFSKAVSPLARRAERFLEGQLGAEDSEDALPLVKRLFVENIRTRVGWYAIAIAAMIVMAVTTAASAWMMREVVNGIIVDQDVTKTFGVAALIAVIFITKGVSNYIRAIYLGRAGNNIVAELQRKAFAKMINSDLAFVSKNGPSELLIRITNAARAAQSVIETLVVSFVRDLFTLIGLVLVMFIQQPALSLIVLVLGPVALLSVRFILKRVREIAQAEWVLASARIRIVQEATAGFKVVKAYALEDVFMGSMGDAISKIESRANAQIRLQSATSPIMETLAGLAIAGVIAFAGLAVLQDGQTPGELMSFITALLLAYEPAKRLAQMRITLEAGMVGVRKLFELLDNPIELREKTDAVDLPRGPGCITFENVGFSYQDGQQVLNELNLTFEPRKTTALVGPSGAGKTTIVNLIMRLYDPDSGSVRIDDTDIRDVTFESLRERIAYVGQDAFLFAGSVRYNISLGRRGASDDEIIAAAKEANAHDFIMSLPDGYETDIGENGNKLSGGQKQRITVARAFLRGSDILILDEATSALDAEAERAIKDAVQRLAEGRTTIVIAHRLSTVAQADHIIVMDNGMLAEQGAPNALLRQNGIYKRFYEHQLLPEAGE